MNNPLCHHCGQPIIEPLFYCEYGALTMERADAQCPFATVDTYCARCAKSLEDVVEGGDAD